MGLSIYYKGRFRKDASLSEMIDEVRDIAEINKWKYHIFETEFDPDVLGKDTFDQNIYGICFSPPKCEPIELTFLSNGIMSDPVSLEFYDNSKDKEIYLYTICSKTQYAGFQVHKIIIDLFRYLSQKYFQEFKLTDESQYWETGDEIVLRQNFKRYNDMMDQFSDALENIPVKENESTESYIERVAKMIQAGRKNKN